MRFLILLVSFIIFFQTNIIAATIMSTKVDGVKLYKKPDTSSAVKFDYPKDFPLKVLAKSKSWCRVIDWMRMQGWVKTSELKKQKSCIVNRARLNFRSGPGTGYRSIGRLTQGNILQILSVTKYWVKGKLVDPNTGQIGWVYRRFIWGI